MGAFISAVLHIAYARIQLLEGNNVEGVLAIKRPWPSIARSVFNDHNRYLDTYMRVCSRYDAAFPLAENYASSHTRGTSTLAMVPPGTNMATFGSRAVLMVLMRSFDDVNGPSFDTQM